MLFFFFFLILFYIVIDSLGSEVGHCVIQFQSINLDPSYTKRRYRQRSSPGLGFFHTLPGC